MLYAKLTSPQGDTIHESAYRALANRERVQYAPLDELASLSAVTAADAVEMAMPFEATEDIARQLPGSEALWTDEVVVVPAMATATKTDASLATAIAFRKALQSMSLTVIDGVTVDMFTANIVVTVLDHLPTEKKIALCRKPVRQICSLALRMVA